MGAVGTAIVDFGGSANQFASVAVTGQTGIATSSSVEAWIRPQDPTAAHSVDEHLVEDIDVRAGNIVAGTGFTIYARIRNGCTTGTFNINWVWA